MGLRDKIKTIIDRLPYVRSLKRKVVFYENELFVPPGHFYSPIANQEEMVAEETKIFSPARLLSGIDLNVPGQMALLNELKKHYHSLPFTEEPIPANRYYYNNDQYCHSDAVFLFLMILNCNPKKIIEIGSGFSSAVMLDCNEKFFSNNIDLTFIEPFPDRLNRIVRPSDKYTLIEKKVQDTDISIFQSLQENDILFIDSTHVAKTNSDVLFELFEILPHLNKGVMIHFHDIFYPFEYPREWVINQKRNWNEIYLLRAFLMYNSQFKIIAFNTYLEYENPEWFGQNMPLCLKNRGGSIWLEKLN